MRAALGVCGVLAALGGEAYADEKLRPTAVAVSSTVHNAAIKPDHLVDGKLDTAWNSRTNELVGAWIAIRVPDTARVTQLKLTAGFTKSDKKLGDLFTKNPRIKKVRVTRNGSPVGDFTLDIENRGLQSIPLDVQGGDLRVTVLEVVPGTKRTWREVCVSELEAWGTSPAVATAKPPAKSPKQPKLVVRLGSLDAYAQLTPAECSKIVRSGRGVSRNTPFAVSDAVTLCHIETKDRDTGDLNVTITAVDRATKKPLGQPIEHALSTSSSDEVSELAEVDIVPYELTSKETGVIVNVTQRRSAPMLDQGDTKATLYRVTREGLVELLAFASTWSLGEGGDADRCHIQEVVPGTAMPKKILVDCVKQHEHWHDPDPADRGIDETPRTDVYRWTGTTYTGP